MELLSLHSEPVVENEDECDPIKKAAKDGTRDLHAKTVHFHDG